MASVSTVSLMTYLALDIVLYGRCQLFAQFGWALSAVGYCHSNIKQGKNRFMIFLSSENTIFRNWF